MRLFNQTISCMQFGSVTALAGTAPRGLGLQTLSARCKVSAGEEASGRIFLMRFKSTDGARCFKVNPNFSRSTSSFYAFMLASQPQLGLYLC